MSSSIEKSYDEKVSIDLQTDLSIKYLRIYNNLAKRLLLSKYIEPNSNVFDVCVGKAGDLDKYEECKINSLYACDISSISINEARSRYNIGYGRGKRPYTFKAHFFIHDVSRSILNEITHVNIDNIVSMFAIHYFFESRDILFIYI